MKKYVFLLSVGLVLFGCAKKAANQYAGEQNNNEIQEVESTYQFGVCVDELDMNEYRVKSGDNLSKIYSGFGFTGTEIEKVVKASAHEISPRNLIPGTKYYTMTTRDSIPRVNNIIFERSKTDFVVLNLSGGDITVENFSKPITTKRKYVEGTVNSSLWNAIVENGAEPMLAMKLADIYAWQVDFFGIRKGDTFKVLYDVAYVDDTIPLNVESIEGAVFTHNKKDYLAVSFTQDDSKIYFDEDGNSLRKSFLKAPLDFFRITSKFTNSRYHPVLKRYRAHHGVDYAAPVGTPVKTIGDGTVVDKGYQKNGGGYYLKVKHNATYTTTYMHLSRYAKGIQKGSRVRQGEVIAYVGSTGLSTGPHLDFRVHKNGTPINPLTMDAPPDVPVKPELRDSFMLVKQNILAEIEQFSYQLALQRMNDEDDNLDKQLAAMQTQHDNANL